MDMTPREYWNHYVERQGGPVKVAEALKIPYSTIAGVCNGSRGIGRKLADRMVAADPLLDRDVLVWVTAEKAAA
jgi:plasmid maintenance system antidote protein VapI